MSRPTPGPLGTGAADPAESSPTIIIASDAGLGAFASEDSTQEELTVAAWPAPRAASSSTPAGDIGSEPETELAWSDDGFVVRFPDGEPVPDTHLMPAATAAPVASAADSPARLPAPPPFAPAVDPSARLATPAPSTTPAGDPPARPAAPRDRARQALLVLAGLVALQAIPTVLWLQGRFAAPPPPPPIEILAAPPPPSAATSGLAPVPEPPVEAPAPPPARQARRQVPAAPASAPAPVTIAAGLLSVDAPVPMQIIGRDGIVGTTEAATIMLPPGTHELEFRSDAVGYRERRTVTLQSGRTTRLRLAPPPGRLHVNALPWAEVWIDGNLAGQTPIGNLETSVGTHEVRFRHPELGERRATVLVTLKEPARVSVDLRQP